MNKNRIYITILFCIALFIYINAFIVSDKSNLGLLIFWIILAIISETFQIILPSGAATSVGMAIYLAALVTGDPFTSITVAIFAFILRMPEVDGMRKYLFKFKPSIIIFNISSHVIFLGIIGKIYMLFVEESALFQSKIVVSLLLLSLSELISIVLVSGYLWTKEGKNEIPLVRSFIGALPSTWAVGSLGLILAFAYDVGIAVVLLFFIPLLLARYSFKLYFDSQKTGQETIEALNAALHYRDAYTASHTRRVEVYTLMLAKEMHYSAKDQERIKMAARLHDIGKIGVPDRILNKPGKLTNEEYQRIKDHSAMGSQILSNVDTFKKITEIVRQHHERPDGRGYPDGLKGDAISLDASILSIADTYDAMTSKRPYRDAMAKEYSLNELRKYRGTQFRSDLVEVFIEALENLDESELAFEMPKTYMDDAHKEEIDVSNQSDEVVYDS